MSVFTRVLIPLLAAGIWPVTAPALEPMTDASMASVHGRSGIAVGLEFRLNVDASGNALGSNCGVASPDYTDGVAEGCRLALNLNNRPGEWLVFKDVYMSLDLPRVYLDAACTSGTASAGNCSGGSSSPSMADPDRFEDENGACLLTGAAGGCVAGDVNNLPAMQFSAPGSALQFEDDILWHLNLGGMAVEYGATGYVADSNGSFLGAVLTDTGQDQARIDIDGTIKMFGF